MHHQSTHSKEYWMNITVIWTSKQLCFTSPLILHFEIQVLICNQFSLDDFD